MSVTWLFVASHKLPHKGLQSAMLQLKNCIFVRTKNWMDKMKLPSTNCPHLTNWDRDVDSGVGKAINNDRQVGDHRRAHRDRIRDLTRSGPSNLKLNCEANKQGGFPDVGWAEPAPLPQHTHTHCTHRDGMCTWADLGARRRNRLRGPHLPMWVPPSLPLFTTAVVQWGKRESVSEWVSVCVSRCIHCRSVSTAAAA